MDKRSKLNVGLERRYRKATNRRLFLHSVYLKLCEMAEHDANINKRVILAGKMFDAERDMAAKLHFMLPRKSYLRLKWIHRCHRHRNKEYAKVSRIISKVQMWLPDRVD